VGAQANIEKDRTCKHCERPFWTTSEQLKEHASLCKRAKAIGLLIEPNKVSSTCSSTTNDTHVTWLELWWRLLWFGRPRKW
jgi:hypothetical protein